MRGLALRIVLARTTILNAIGGCALSSYENRSHEMIGYIKSLTDSLLINKSNVYWNNNLVN